MTVGVAALGVVDAVAGAGVVLVVDVVAFAIAVGEGGVLTIRVSV